MLATTALQAAQAPPPAGFNRTPLFDNGTVNVFRLMLQPGARETPHTHQNSMLVVWISRGDVEMLNGQQRPARTRQVWRRREPVHTHPYDLVVIPLTTSKLEVQIGSDKQTRDYGPGNSLFIARNQPHAVANVGFTTIR